MDINTNGRKSSEFWLAIVAIVLVSGLVVAENALGWTLNGETKTMLMSLVGVVVAYIGGRSWYKGKKADAMRGILLRQGDRLIAGTTKTDKPAEKPETE